MGVPSFYRWLAQKFPRVVLPCIESSAHTDESPDMKNPNQIEFDHLYLDMNGIIHPCTHPIDGATPSSESEMRERIFHYIDRIFRIVRPRKLLYMAIDGVAPRAKMNQQRSRRFRAAKEVKLKEEAEEKLRQEWEEAGKGHKILTREGYVG